MRIKFWLPITLLYIICLCACNQGSTIVKHDIQLTAIDSSDHSAKIVSLQLFNVGDNFFASAAGEQKTAEVYTINEDGKLDFLEQYPVTSKAGGLRALTNIKIKDSNLVVLGNKADNSLEVYRVEANGVLDKINSVADSDSTYIDEIVTIHHIQIHNRTFIYAGGLDKGMSCFELTENGSLHHIQSIEDNESLFLHGIIGMTSLAIDDKTFLITGAFFDGGISCFEVLDNGHLKNVSHIKDDMSLFLNGAFPVNSVQLGNEYFILVGHRHSLHYRTVNAQEKYHGDGINVFKVNADGQLTLHSLLKDDEHLRLKGSTRIEIIKMNDNEAFVFIATRDDTGIQICKIEQDGILKPIKSVDLGYSIYNGMTIEFMNDQWYLLSGSYHKNILELYTIDFE